jgi:hypothetical protein
VRQAPHRPAAAFSAYLRMAARREHENRRILAVVADVLGAPARRPLVATVA